jgi:uncharacterized membrane protein
LVTWLKLIHIAAISIWMAGLLSLPGLYVQRATVGEEEHLYRLQRIVRFAYVRIVSPAAFLAVASGTALIFLREAFVPWLSAKLALVALLAIIHALTGLVVIRLFKEGEVYPVWRFMATTALIVVLICGVLFLVLAKPVFDPARFVPTAMTEPGGLGRLVRDFNPWQTP